MKIKTLVTLSALSLSVQAQVSSQEPVQAIEPVEGLNPSLVKLGKKAVV
jgi:cytochrome c peroxidase